MNDKQREEAAVFFENMAGKVGKNIIYAERRGDSGAVYNLKRKLEYFRMAAHLFRESKGTKEN